MVNKTQRKKGLKKNVNYYCHALRYTFEVSCHPYDTVTVSSSTVSGFLEHSA